MYWQKQLAGCALSLAQHAAVGAAFPMMAGAHGVSCVGAHVVVAAPAPGARLAITALDTASAARKSARDACLLLLAAMIGMGSDGWMELRDRPKRPEREVVPGELWRMESVIRGVLIGELE